MKLTMCDDDGNPVVSKDIPDPVEVEIPLMSIRDYFAAAALTGTLSCSTASREGEVVAVSCYRFADAMLKARKT